MNIKELAVGCVPRTDSLLKPYYWYAEHTLQNNHNTDLN